jgi:hypothetical protein
LEAVFLLGVWQGFCKSQWRSTWKSPAKGPLISAVFPNMGHMKSLLVKYLASLKSSQKKTETGAAITKVKSFVFTAEAKLFYCTPSVSQYL